MSPSLRADKQDSVERLREALHRYLSEHPKAKPATVDKALRAHIARLKSESRLAVEVEGRAVQARVNQPALEVE